MKLRADGIPRRCDILLHTPGEKAIREAILVVEGLGAHPLLTEASVLLTKAKDLVADFVEFVELEGSR